MGLIIATLLRFRFVVGHGHQPTIQNAVCLFPPDFLPLAQGQRSVIITPE